MTLFFIFKLLRQNEVKEKEDIIKYLLIIQYLFNFSTTHVLGGKIKRQPTHCISEPHTDQPLFLGWLENNLRVSIVVTIDIYHKYLTKDLQLRMSHQILLGQFAP